MKADPIDYQHLNGDKHFIKHEYLRGKNNLIPKAKSQLGGYYSKTPKGDQPYMRPFNSQNRHSYMLGAPKPGGIHLH